MSDPLPVARRPAAFAMKLIVGLGLLALVVSRADLKAVGAALAGLDGATIAVAMAFFLIAHVVNGLKLQILLTDRPVADLIRFTFVALFYGAVLPGQLLGDAVKAYRLVRPGDDVAAVAAGVVVDKITGLSALLILSGLGLLLERAAFPVGFAAVTFAMLLGLMAALYLPMVAALIPRWLDNVFGRFLRAWREGAAEPWRLLISLGAGLVFQIIAVAVVAYVGTGLGIHLSFAAWAAVVGLVSVVLLLPVTIAGVGLREGGLVVLLGLLGVSAADALALSFVLLAFTLFGAAVGAVADLTAKRA